MDAQLTPACAGHYPHGSFSGRTDRRLVSVGERGGAVIDGEDAVQGTDQYDQYESSGQDRLWFHRPG